MLPFRVRKAEIDDIKYIHGMIQELVDFQELSSGPKITIEDLIRDAGLNGDHPYCHCLVAEPSEPSSSSGGPLTRVPIVGYSICCYTYSSCNGRCYFIEDIYVKPEYRHKGVGQLLFKEIVRTADELNCHHIDFHVLNWNPACKFYEKLGAQNLSKTDNWNLYRMENEQIKQVINLKSD